MTYRVVGIGAVAVIVGIIFGPVAGLLAAIAIAALPLVIDRRQRQRERLQLPAELSVILELAARFVRTGSAVADALETAAGMEPGPAGDLVSELVWWLRRDAQSDAVRSWQIGSPNSSVSVVSAIIGMVGGSNGGAARGLEAGAAVLRERDRTRKEVAAGASQVRASAAVLVGLPLVLGIATLLATPDIGARLASQPSVVAAVVAGGALELAGGWWIRRLVHTVQREAW